MTDMSAFERQLSAELEALMGPVQPVDDAAIMGAITAGRSPTGRLRSAFSVSRFVLVGAVATLIGGLLLAGLLSRPQAVDRAPAASASSGGTPRLVYVLDGDLYLADEDGTEPVRILEDHPGERCGGAAVGRGLVSPDGRHIAYRSEWSDDCPGTVTILDGNGHLVATVPGSGWAVAWSPDSTRFATWLSLWRTIGVYGIDGSLLAELDASMGSGGDWDPKWDPDGTALLIPMSVGTAGTSQGLVGRLPLDGGEPVIVPATEPLSIRSVSFSPDGTRVASSGPDGQLIVAAPDEGAGESGFEFFGGPEGRVAGGWSFRPLWSPDGDRIAVVFGGWQPASLWVIDSATGADALDVAGAEDEGYLEPIAFSPDGEHILVWMLDADGGPGLWSVASDGSGSTLVVDRAEYGGWVWPPGTGEDPPDR